MSKHKIEFILPADLKYSTLVRHLSEEIFHGAGFSKEWASRLKLVVDELFMNAKRYGSGSPDDSIRMCFEFSDTEVSFLIEDQGRGAKKIGAGELKKIIKKNSSELHNTTKTNGRGLALISSLWTDGMKIANSEKGGIAVTFKKKIATTAPPAPNPEKPGPQSRSRKKTKK